MRPLVVWDMDEVLVNLRDIVCERMGPLHGRVVDWRQWHVYQGFSVHFGAEEDAFHARMVEARILEDCAPEPGALEALSALRSQGCRQAIVTARGWHPDAEEVTRAWLARHGLGRLVDELAIVPVFASKVDTIRALGPAAIYAEDAAHHADAAIEHCDVATVALMHRPWNEGHQCFHPSLVRVRHLAEVVALHSQGGES